MIEHHFGLLLAKKLIYSVFAIRQVAKQSLAWCEGSTILSYVCKELWQSITSRFKREALCKILGFCTLVSETCQN